MHCPHCGNDNPKMIERVSFTPITFMCHVCSKTWLAPALDRLSGPRKV